MFKNLIKEIKGLWKEWQDDACQKPRVVVLDAIGYGTIAIAALIFVYPYLVPPTPPAPVIVQQTVPTPQQLYSTYQLEVLGTMPLVIDHFHNVQLTPEQTRIMKSMIVVIGDEVRGVLEVTNTNEVLSQTQLRKISTNLEHYKACIIQTARDGKFSPFCQTLAQQFKIDPTKPVPPPFSD